MPGNKMGVNRREVDVELHSHIASATQRLVYTPIGSPATWSCMPTEMRSRIAPKACSAYDQGHGRCGVRLPLEQMVTIPSLGGIHYRCGSVAVDRRGG